MRTRTLLLLAIACGTLILVAGVIQLLRVAGDEEGSAATATMGETVTIGDLDVTVDAFSETAGAVDVTITIGGVDDPDGTDRFRLVVSSPPALAPIPDDADESAGDADGGGEADREVAACAGTTEAVATCRLHFELPADPGTSRVLNLRRGDEAVNWILDDA